MVLRAEQPDRKGIALIGKDDNQGHLYCTLKRSNFNAILLVKVGQLITVSGQFERQAYFQPDNRYNADLAVENCEVTNFFPSVPADLAYAPAKPLGPSTRSLSGLFWHASMNVMAFGGSSQSFSFYLFTPDGHVYNGFPAGGTLDHFSFTAAAAKDPQHTGYYRITGSTIEFNWSGGAPERSEFRKDGDAYNLSSGSWYGFDLNQARSSHGWLMGSFRHQSGAVMGSVAGVAQSWYTFHPDGTFDTQGISTTTTGARVPQANRSGSATRRGTYQISGTTLTLRYTGGAAENHTALPFGKGIFLDGALYIRP